MACSVEGGDSLQVDTAADMTEGNHMPHSRTHVRSASWTLGGSRDGESSHSSISNSLRSVFREFVPGLSTTTHAPSSTAGEGSVYGSRLEGNDSNMRLPSSGSQLFRRQESHHSLGGPFNGDDSDESNGSRTEFQSLLKWLEKGLPFFILLWARVAIEHRLGVLVLIGLFVTFIHANHSIKRQVELKDRVSFSAVLFIIGFLICNISCIYYAFASEHLYRCFFMCPPTMKITLSSAIWTVVINDFSTRFFTMVLKCVILLTYSRLLPYKCKGKYYLLLEYISQFYRALLPIAVWFTYFYDYEALGKVLSILFTTAYVLYKGVCLIESVRVLRQAVTVFFKDHHYGSRPSQDAVTESGSLCPICQEEIRDPTMLPCRHIFCDDCVSMWFDRERTCPMCRATVADDPRWRDGSTTMWLQIY